MPDERLRDWSALSAEEAAEAGRRDPVVILPLAATEQHGPHLPTSTDCDIGEGLLASALRQLSPDTEAWVLHMVTVGASEEHARFPGTTSVTTAELARTIVARGAELARTGVRRLVLSNSHGGNRAAMDAAALTLRARHDMLVVKASWPRFARPDGVGLPEAEWRHGLHGGAIETAMMLHLRPERVRRAAVDDFRSLGEELEGTLSRLRPEGEAPFAWLAGDLNPHGVTGDARLATPEMGARLVEHYGRVLAEIILDTAMFPLDRLQRRAAGPLSAPIDERTAWDLVRALVPGSVARGSSVRVVTGSEPGSGSEPGAELRSEPGAWIEVVEDGSWTASSEVGDAARDVLDVYLPLRVPADLVIGQLGQSLDGHIATEGGASHYVTGPKDIERVHRLRALVDAVIVGAATVAQDDPRLTVRLVEGPNPVRVVLDPSGQLEAEQRVFSEPDARTLVVRGTAPAPATGSAPPTETLHVALTEEGGLDLVALLDQLRARGLRRILVEGGGVTVSRFLQAGLLDRLHLAVAPLLIGSGRPSISLDPVASLDEALRPRCRRFTLGEDVLFDLDFRSRPA